MGTLPQALELTPSPLHLVILATRPNAGHRQHSHQWCWHLFRCQISSGGASPMSIPVSASLTSSSIAPSMGCHSSYTCATSRPKADRDRSSTWSALAMHSPRTTSSAYQCPPSPPQFGHLQFGMPSGHGMNWEAAGQGTTDTG